MADRPRKLQINAWAGWRVDGDPGDALLKWALQPRATAPPKFMLPPKPVDLGEWADPSVGWGLILRDSEELDEPARARGADAPEPIQRLLAARPGAPVLRYRKQTANSHLRRYYEDRGPQDIALSASKRGIGPGELPRYLLIYGPPAQIPWSLQYVLNQSAAVGRLALEGEALDNYVSALLSDWDDSRAVPTHAVLWAVDHGSDDITRVMRTLIAAKLSDEFRRDAADLGPGTVYLDGAEALATRDRLIDTLADHRPALVVTTSHGMTGPIDDADATRQNLGLLVDQDYELVEPGALLGKWEPDGAIWYSHACCSAGSDAVTRFEGLVAADSPVERVLKGVAAIGAHVAPLPQALLGAPKPLRAFVGHVEPTFDWTIRDPQTGQALTASIQEAIGRGLYVPWPIGNAFRECYRHVGELLAQRDGAYKDFDRGHASGDTAAAAQLAALDRQSMVILGDPTVALPISR